MAEKKHAKLSASGAHRWMGCAASVGAEDGLENKSTVYSLEGDAAHDLGEQCLRGGVNADTYLGDNVLDHKVDREMVDAVQDYLDHVRDLPGRLLVEKKVDFSPWVPGGFGTADAIVLEEGTATIVDLKYGKGVRVDAEENPQLMLYALGAVNDFGFLYDIKSVRVMVVQPRKDHVSIWPRLEDPPLGVSDLLDWGSTVVEPAARLALAANAPFNPGEKQCKWCKAKPTCRALAEHSLNVATDGFGPIGEPLELKPFDKLSNFEIAQLLPQLNTLTDWVKAVEAYALHELEAGRDVPGYKLVEGRSLRKWIDEVVAEKALRGVSKLKVADIFVQKLISPAQAEKKLGKGHKVINDNSEKPVGKPAIAPVSDKRPALTINPTEGYDAVDVAA